MKIIYKFISLPLAIIFLFQSIGWTLHNYQLSPINYQPIHIPERYGRVEKCQTNPQIVIIKDAHCNYEAQKNISQILDILIKDYKFDLVGSEGASGFVNPQVVLEGNPKEDVRVRVSEKFLKTGLLTASEALSIKKGKKPGFTIWGVEDLKIYLKDFQLFRDNYYYNKDVKDFIEIVDNLLIQLKEKLYTTEIKRFDRVVKGYEQNKLSLIKYIRIIYSRYNIPKRYRNIKLILKAIKLEDVIDFKKVEYEREQLIRHMEKTLPKEEIKELVEKSLLFRLGKISSVDYYTYLNGKTTNIRNYTRLLKLHARIDEDCLLEELDRLTEEIYYILSHDESIYNLYLFEKDINILKKITSLEARRDEVSYYKENPERFALERLLNFIRKEAAVNQIDIPKKLSNPTFLEKVKKAMIPADGFYTIALERDRAIVENLLRVMERNKKDRAILICGGFHADGIKNLLQRRGISTITITPSITKLQDDAKELYLRRMLDERIDPEKLLKEYGLENITPLLATSKLGRELGLPQPIIEALLKEHKYDELRGKTIEELLPLLRHLYTKAKGEGNSVLCGLIENIPGVIKEEKGEDLQSGSQSIIPSLEAKVVRLGGTDLYKLFFGPFIEEILFRYTPFSVFFKGLMPQWYRNVTGETVFKRFFIGIIYSFLYFTSFYLGYGFSQFFYIAFFLLSIPLIWGFITSHPEGRREGSWIVSIGIMGGLFIGLIIFNTLYTLIIPISWHIVTNIVQKIRQKPLGIVDFFQGIREILKMIDLKEVTSEDWVLPLFALMNVVEDVGYTPLKDMICKQILNIARNAHFSGGEGYILRMKINALICIYLAGSKLEAEKELERLGSIDLSSFGYEDKKELFCALGKAYVIMGKPEMAKGIFDKEFRDDKYEYGNKGSEILCYLYLHNYSSVTFEEIKQRFDMEPSYIKGKLLKDYIKCIKKAKGEEEAIKFLEGYEGNQNISPGIFRAWVALGRQEDANNFYERNKSRLSMDEVEGLKIGLDIAGKKDSEAFPILKRLKGGKLLLALYAYLEQYRYRYEKISAEEVDKELKQIIDNWDKLTSHQREKYSSLLYLLTPQQLNEIKNIDLFIEAIRVYLSVWKIPSTEVISSIIRRVTNKSLPWETRIELLKFFPLSKLFERGSEELRKTLVDAYEEDVNRIREGGGFRKDILAHKFIGYISILSLPNAERCIHESFGWEDWESLREQEAHELTDVDKAEIKYLAYEAYILLKEVIIPCMVRAKSLNKPLCIVENLSYGGVALSPIKDDLQEIARKVGVDLRIISTKQGSTECHWNEYVFNPDLFTREEIQYIAENEPIVLIFDGSTSVDADSNDRTSAHYPDAYKGYRNFFTVLDYCRGRKYSKEFGEDFQDIYFSEEELKSKIGQLPKELHPVRNPYKMEFITLSGNELYLRVEKQPTKTPRKFTIQQIDGPTVVFVQTAMRHEDIIRRSSFGDKAADEVLRQSHRHEAAYFDDKDNFTRLTLTVGKNGPCINMVINGLARGAYLDLIQSLSDAISIPTTLKAPGSMPPDEDIPNIQIPTESGGAIAIDNELKESLQEILTGKSNADLENLQLHIIDKGALLGFPRKEDSTKPQELVYAYGKNINGTLHIYVTTAFWKVLQGNLLMLAFLIDHEWQENIEHKSHRDASKRAWEFKDEIGMNPFYRFYLDQLLENGQRDELVRIINSPEHQDENGLRFKEYAKRLLPPPNQDIIHKVNTRLLKELILNPKYGIPQEIASSIIDRFEREGTLPMDLPVIPNDSDVLFLNGRLIVLVGDDSKLSLLPEYDMPCSVVGNIIFIARGLYSREEAERLIVEIDALNRYLQEMQMEGEISCVYAFPELVRKTSENQDRRFPHLFPRTRLFRNYCIYHDVGASNIRGYIDTTLQNILTLFRRIVIDQALVEDINHNIGNIPLNSITLGLLKELKELTDKMVEILYSPEQGRDLYAIQELINKLDMVNSKIFILRHIPPAVTARLEEGQLLELLDKLVDYHYSRITWKGLEEYLTTLSSTEQLFIISAIRNILGFTTMHVTKFQSPIAIYSIFGQTFVINNLIRDNCTVINTNPTLIVQRLIKDFQVFKEGQFQEDGADRVLESLGVFDSNTRKELITNWKSFVENKTASIDSRFYRYGFNKAVLRGNLDEYELNLDIAGDYSEVARDPRGLDVIISTIRKSPSRDIVIESHSPREAVDIAHFVHLIREDRLVKYGERYYEIISVDRVNKLVEIQDIYNKKILIVEEKQVEIIKLPIIKQNKQFFIYNGGRYEVVNIISDKNIVVVNNGYGQVQYLHKDKGVLSEEIESCPVNVKVLCRLHINPQSQDFISPRELKVAQTLLEEMAEGRLDRDKLKNLLDKSEELREFTTKQELTDSDYGKIKNILEGLIEKRKMFVDDLRKIDGFVCVSEKTKQIWIRYYPELSDKKFYIVKNEIMYPVYESSNMREDKNGTVSNPQKINLLRKLGIEKPEEKTVIAYVGRIEEKKGWLVLKNIILKLSDDPNCVFLLGTACESVDKMVEDLKHFLNGEVKASDGTYRRDERIAAQVERLIREGRLKIVPDLAKYGYIINHSNAKNKEHDRDVLCKSFGSIVSSRLEGIPKGVFTPENITIDIPIQSAADILVHPTHTEAYGLVIQEANAAGAYIIASHLGGIPEIIDPTADSLVHRIIWDDVEGKAREFWEISHRTFIEILKTKAILKMLTDGVVEDGTLELIYPGENKKMTYSLKGMKEDDIYLLLKKNLGCKITIGDVIYIIYSDYIEVNKPRNDIKTGEDAIKEETEFYIEAIKHYKKMVGKNLKRRPPVIRRNLAKTTEAHIEILCAPTPEAHIITQPESKDLRERWITQQRERAPPINFPKIKEQLERGKSGEEIKKLRTLYHGLIRHLREESWKVSSEEEYIEIAMEYIKKHSPTTLKAPGSMPPDEDIPNIQIPTESGGAIAIDNELKESLQEILTGKSNANLENLKLHIIDKGALLGFPRKEDSTKPQDLVYAYGKNINGTLHIYVTTAFWKVLEGNLLMLAFLIDHEWQENIEHKSHRDASKRAWEFKDEIGMNPFYRFYLDQLLENGQRDELVRIINSPEHQDENSLRFKEYAKRLLLGKYTMAEIEIVSNLLGSPEVLHLCAENNYGPMVVAQKFGSLYKKSTIQKVEIAQGDLMDKIRKGLQGEDVEITDEEWKNYINQAISINIPQQGYIILHDFEFLPLVSKLKGQNKTVIWHCHLDLDYVNTNIWNRLLPYINQCDAVILQPRVDYKKLNEKLGINVPVVFMPPLTIDPTDDKNRPLEEEDMNKLPEGATSLKGTPYFLYLGRLDSQKGIKEMISAFIKMYDGLPEDKKDVRLVIAYPPQDKERVNEVQGYIQDKYRKNIMLLQIPDDKTADITINYLQRNAIAGLQLSQREGFGLPVAEMLYKGKPVIGTEVGGIKMQIRHDLNGYLVKPGDIEGAAGFMKTLLLNESERNRLGSKARELAEEEYLLSNLVLNYLNILYALRTKVLEKGPITCQNLRENIWGNRIFKIAHMVANRLKAQEEDKSDIHRELEAIEHIIYYMLTDNGRASVLVLEKLKNILWRLYREKRFNEDIDIMCINLPIGAINTTKGQEWADRFKDIFFERLKYYMDENKREAMLRFKDEPGGYQGYSKTRLYLIGLGENDIGKIEEIFNESLKAVGIEGEFKIYIGHRKFRLAEVSGRIKEEEEEEKKEERLNKLFESLTISLFQEAVGMAEYAEKELKEGFLSSTHQDFNQYRQECINLGSKKFIPELEYESGKLPRLRHIVGFLGRIRRGIYNGSPYYTIKMYISQLHKIIHQAYKDIRYSGGFKRRYVEARPKRSEEGGVIAYAGDEFWFYSKDGVFFGELDKFNAFNEAYPPDLRDSFYYQIISWLRGKEPKEIQLEELEIKTPEGPIYSNGYQVKTEGVDINGLSIPSEELLTIKSGEICRITELSFHSSEKVMIDGVIYRLKVYCIKNKSTREEIRRFVVHNNRIYTADGKGKEDEEDITDFVLSHKDNCVFSPVVATLGITITTNKKGYKLSQEQLSAFNAYQKKYMGGGIKDVEEIITHQIQSVLRKYNVIFKENSHPLPWVIEKAVDGKMRIDFGKLIEAIPSEKVFEILVEISRPINKLLGEEARSKGAVVLGAILREILKQLPREEREKVSPPEKGAEESLLETIKHIASKKGVDPNAIQSIFDLFKGGIDILTLDPELDPGQIDGSYFTLIQQLGKLTGISEGAIINAFRDNFRINVKISQGKIIEGSLLHKEAQKLARYNEKQEGQYKITKDDQELWALDFGEGSLVDDKENNRNKYLSGHDVVGKDVKAICKALGKYAQISSETGVICHIEDFITLNPDGTFSYKPGVEAIIRKLDENKNIKIVFIGEDKDRKYTRILNATGRFGTNLFLEEDLNSANEKLQGININNIAYLTTNQQKVEEAKGLGIKKIILTTPNSSFHASLLFAVLYAQVSEENRDSFLWHFLKLMGYKDDEIRDAIKQRGENGYLTIEFIRIKDTLEEFQSRKLIIMVAA